MSRLSEQDKTLLFRLAKEAKNKGNTLAGVFVKVAKQAKMSPGSVRNFYYKTIADDKKTEFTVRRFEPFTQEEEMELVRAVLRERAKTPSLSKAFLNLADGDKSLALRYRNKFANMLKKHRSGVMREVLRQKQLGNACFNPYTDRKEHAERLKLKGEINALIKIINTKCAKENAALKQKIRRYEKLNGEFCSAYPIYSLIGNEDEKNYENCDKTSGNSKNSGLKNKNSKNSDNKNLYNLKSDNSEKSSEIKKTKSPDKSKKSKSGNAEKTKNDSDIQKDNLKTGAEIQKAFGEQDISNYGEDKMGENTEIKSAEDNISKINKGEKNSDFDNSGKIEISDSDSESKIQERTSQKPNLLKFFFKKERKVKEKGKVVK